MPKKIDTSPHPDMREGGRQQKANAAYRKRVADKKLNSAKKHMRFLERFRKARNANIRRARGRPLKKD